MLRVCTSDAVGDVDGPLYWIAPRPGGRMDRYRPASAVEPPEGMLPPPDGVARVARGEWNLDVFERVYTVQLISAGGVDRWARQLVEDAALVCHPHQPGSYCHGATLGRYLAVAYPTLAVQIEVPEPPRPAAEELLPITDLAGELDVTYARLKGAIDRGKLWSVRQRGRVCSTLQLARQYIASQAESCG